MAYLQQIVQHVSRAALCALRLHLACQLVQLLCCLPCCRLQSALAIVMYMTYWCCLHEGQACRYDMLASGACGCVGWWSGVFCFCAVAKLSTGIVVVAAERDEVCVSWCSLVGKAWSLVWRLHTGCRALLVLCCSTSSTVSQLLSTIANDGGEAAGDLEGLAGWSLSLTSSTSRCLELARSIKLPIQTTPYS